MPTNNENPSVARSTIQLNLTAAGWAVVVLLVAAGFISSSSRLAIGFFIPLVAALAIDLYLSWHVVSRHSVTITPSRTVVHKPDGLPLRVQASGVRHPMRATLTFRGAVENSFGLGSEPEIIELAAEQTGASNYVRADLACTVFGLAIAHRWETHSMPMLHWAPPPGPKRLTTPNAIDEVARLREYVPGDRMSRVSWPVTARTGRMHVRASGVGEEEFVVVLNLGPAQGEPGEGAIVSEAPASSARPTIAILEATLTLASTLVTQLLEDGHEVRLITAELAPEHFETLRQSAIDNPRLPAVLPNATKFQMHAVDRYVVDDEDLARRLSLAEVTMPISWGYGPYVDVSMLGMRSLP